MARVDSAYRRCPVLNHSTHTVIRVQSLVSGLPARVTERRGHETPLLEFTVNLFRG